MGVDGGTGLFGLQITGKDSVGLNGISLMAGNMEAGGAFDVLVVNADLRFGGWFAKPFVGGFIGYKAVGFDESELNGQIDSLFGSVVRQQPNDNVWEILHGPVVGLAGYYPLKWSYPEIAKPEWSLEDIRIYYRVGFVPILMLGHLDGEEADSVEKGTGMTIEVGALLDFSRSNLRLGYRSETLEGAGNADEKFSGIVLGMDF